MKTKIQKCSVPKGKLRQKLKNLKNLSGGDQSAYEISEDNSHQQESAKAKKKFKTSDEVLPNARKRNKSTSKTHANPGSKKAKINIKSASFLESACNNLETCQGNEKSKATKNKTNKQTISNQNKGKDRLPLVQRNGSFKSKEQPSDNDNSIVTFKNCCSFDYDYDNDLYPSCSEEYSGDSDDYFEDSYSNYEESEYSDSETEFLLQSESFSESDPDYELPQNIPEDLIIHKGTAKKHDIGKDADVDFDSEDNDPQIFELSSEMATKIITQPEAYAQNELCKLNENCACLEEPDIIIGKREKNEIEKDCPALVPILDKDGFQLQNTESDYSSSIEFSSDSSINDEDINQKYIRHGNECMDERIKNREPVLKVGIINVTNCTPKQASKTSDLQVVDNLNRTEIDEAISECLATEKLPLNVTSVSVCKTTTMPDKAEGFVKNNHKDSINQSNMEMEAQNDNAIQSPQSFNAEMMIVDEDRIIRSEPPAIKKNANQIGYADGDLLPRVTQLPQTTDLTKKYLHFRTLFFNAVNSNLVLVLLKDPFYLYGTVCVTILAGKVEIYGYKPRLKEEFEIFSPRGCSSVQIINVSGSEVVQISDVLKTLLSSFSSSDLERIERDFESGRDAILLLRRNTRRKKLKNMFKKYMNENVFPNMNSIQPDRRLYASEYLLDCVINTENERALRVPQEWRNIAFTPKSKVLIAGGKSVGKSTLLRFLLNSQLEHYKHVLVIDLDIGQAEIFVPQTVSCTILSSPLLGPGFFLNHQPTRAYVVGHSNIVLSAQSYVRAVKKLIDFCYSKEEFSGIPWLINTMGYNKGFGLELMSVICQLIKPTDIVQLQSNRDINNFDELLHPNVLASIPPNIYDSTAEREKSMLEYQLHVFSSAVVQESRYQRDWEMSSKDLRYATFLSRLSDALQDNAGWLTDSLPLSVLVEKLQVVNMACNESTREELIQGLEANIVYLCRKDNGNNHIECFGIGIVRAIDLKKLYLLPAMAYEHLAEVDCLTLGEMPLPSSFFTNQGPKVRKLAAFLYDTVDARTSKSIKQIYHRPSQFLKGKHKKLLTD